MPKKFRPAGDYGLLKASTLKVKRIGKKCLNLPQRASVDLLYLSYQRGGLNLLPMNIVADISQIVHGLGLL